MRDTADFEEEWGDETEASINSAMINSRMFHSPKHSSLVAAYRAKDLEEETRSLRVKRKHRNGKSEMINLKFKDSYKDEYTCEELPIGHVRRAMHEELEYFCDKVWVALPLAEAQADSEGKSIGSKLANCDNNDINDPDVRCRLVAQEVNLHEDDNCYAATPPPEANMFLCSQWATEQKRGNQRL